MSCNCGNSSSDTPTIDVYRGDSIEFSLQAKRANARTGAVLPYDLTGAKVWCTMKRAVDDLDSAAVAQVSTTSSMPLGGSVTIATPPDSGWVDIVIPPAATSSLPAIEQTFVCDVQVKDAAGVVKTISRFYVRVLPDVTLSTV